MKTVCLSQYTIGDPDVSSSQVQGGQNDDNKLTILVADIPAFKPIGLSEKPAMILGQDLLQRSNNQIGSISQTRNNSNRNQITLDLSNNYIYIPR